MESLTEALLALAGLAGAMGAGAWIGRGSKPLPTVADRRPEPGQRQEPEIACLCGHPGRRCPTHNGGT